MVACRLPWQNLTGLDERLAKAFCRFNSQGGGVVDGDGRLVQAWVPKSTSSGSVFLNTKELPVSICGVGDVLALFRYVCCGCELHPDVTRKDSLGAVGRVFVTGQPEVLLENGKRPVSAKFSGHVYSLLHGVHSAMCLPLFADASRASVVGVLEIVCLNKDSNFITTLRLLIECLEMAQLHSVCADDLELMHSKVVSMQRLQIRNNSGS